MSEELKWDCGRKPGMVTATLVRKTLVISGKGAMVDYAKGKEAPWRKDEFHITGAVVEDGVTSIGDNAFYGCVDLVSVRIPDSVVSIGDAAFECCASLMFLAIPNSVTDIAQLAFRGCYRLMSFDVAADNPRYRSERGVLFDRDMTALIQYPSGKRGTYTIPDGITSIGVFAFDDCSGLTSVAIPESVTKIDDFAFCGSDSLAAIINYCPTPPKVDSNAFGHKIHDDIDTSSVCLYVPPDSVFAYREADIWKDFDIKSL